MSGSDRNKSDSGVLFAWPEVDNFSLVLGGPLYQFFRKTHLEDRVEDHLAWRIVIISGVVWLPLLVLSLVEGTLLESVPIPFIGDVETHVRFLVVVPLLILAELLVHLRVRGIVAQFIERRLVPEAALERFQAALQSAMRLRNSMAAELLIIAIIYPLGHYLRGDVLALEYATWYAQAGDGSSTPTLAGLWFLWVSNPIYQFLLLRWYFRLFIWTRLLWQVSRIDLDLIPTHPDRNAGLGFLGGSAFALSPLLTAHGAALAGFIANSIFYAGASLIDYKLEIVALVVFLMLLAVGPLCVFAPQILAARRLGSREYGQFCAEYMRGFDRRWLHTADRDGETLLGAADIQSLADLGTAFNVVREIKPFPFGRETIIRLIAAVLVPFVPLLFTLMPLEVLLDHLIGAVF
jgi:hypothetical protein